MISIGKPCSIVLLIGVLLQINIYPASAQSSRSDSGSKSYSERYRERYNSGEYQDGYRENYRANNRYLHRINRDNRLESFRPMLRSAVPSRKPSALERDRRRLNVPQDNRGSGSLSSGSTSPAPIFLLQPPSLMQGYMAGQAWIFGSTDPSLDDATNTSQQVLPEEDRTLEVVSPKELMFLRGIEMLHNQRFQSALRIFSELMDIDSNKSEIRLGYGFALLATRQFEDAADILLQENLERVDWALFFPDTNQFEMQILRLQQHVERNPIVSRDVETLLMHLRDVDMAIETS